MPDPVAEAEDLRIVALVLAVENQLPRAEKALREVIGRAELHQRLLLQGEATRDLAVVLRRAGRTVEAQTAALAAKGIFARMGAESEIGSWLIRAGTRLSPPSSAARSHRSMSHRSTRTQANTPNC